MAESSRNYFVALGTALERAGDVGTVKEILHHALEFFRSGRLYAGDGVKDWQRKLRTFGGDMQQPSVEGNLRSRFLGLFMPPWGTWPSSLLSIVVCDWWNEFTPQEKDKYFYPFFLECPVMASVTALVAYLSALGPDRSGSPPAHLSGTDVGLEVLQKVLTDEHMGKLKEVPTVVMGNGIPDEEYCLMNEFGTTLVKLPDMLAGAISGAKNKWAELAPGKIMGTITKKLLHEFDECCQSFGEEGNHGDVNVGARYRGIRFLSGMFDKMVRRGYVAEVATAILENGMVERVVCGREGAFPVTVFLDMATKAKVFERMVNSMCWPELWRDDVAIGVLSRFVGPDVVSAVDAKGGKEILHILTADCFLKSVFAFPVIHWVIDILAAHGDGVLMEAAKRLLISWSDEECVRTIGLPQQAYMTTTLSALLEKLHDNGVDVLKENDLTGMIMVGVSTRLGNPSETINYQGMRVAAIVKKGKTGEQLLASDADDTYLKLAREEMWLGAELRFLDISKTSTESTPPGVPVESDEAATERGGEKDRVDDAVDSDDDSDYATSDGYDFEPLDLSEGSDGMPMVGDRPATLRDMVTGLRNAKEPKKVVSALKTIPLLIESSPEELGSMASDIGKALVYAPVPDWADDDEKDGGQQHGRWGLPGLEKYRFGGMVSLLSVCPVESGQAIIAEVYSTKLTIMGRLGIMDALGEAAKRLANGGEPPALGGSSTAGGVNCGSLMTGSGGGYEAPTTVGKSRIWGVRSLEKRKKDSQRVFRNQFVNVAVSWAVALLEECDKVKHGVDLFGRDHMLLGRLLVTLGTFAQCTSQTTVSAKMALVTLELISSPGIHKHPEPVIRKSALSAAFHVISGLPPARVAAATLGDRRGDAGDAMLAERLEWLRGWTLGVASSDRDGTCRLLASGCVRLQGEVASKAMEFLGNSERGVVELSKGSIDYQLTW